jgi:hypothetical protein
MELDRGGISSKRWTDVSDCDINHGAPRTVASLTAPRYQAKVRTGMSGVGVRIYVGSECVYVGSECYNHKCYSVWHSLTSLLESVLLRTSEILLMPLNDLSITAGPSLANIRRHESMFSDLQVDINLLPG